MRRLAIALSALGSAACFAPAARAEERKFEGVTAGGARWEAVVPDNWNGTLLLWGRGFAFRLGNPEVAPAEWRAALLAEGYALAASNYGSAGWALAEAVPAQTDTIAAFTSAYRKPRRTIAWGSSMGGLVTTALAEQRGSNIQGAIAFCPSIGGAIGMMNMGLDGAFAFKQLIPEASGLELANIRDDMASSRLAATAAAAALKTPEGRARLALAGVFGGIPGWTRRDRPKPMANDFEAQVNEIGASFVMGVVLPRTDQERRAGGNFSWNTGVNYRRQLALSGRRAFVEALYRKAGLDLERDLAILAAAPRVSSKPAAVRYMLQHYTPTARPLVPIISVQAIGDGLTSPALQQAYIDAAPARMASGVWLNEAGHCAMNVEQARAALRHVEARIERGKWPVRPAGAIDFEAQPMMRPCFRTRRCR